MQRRRGTAEAAQLGFDGNLARVDSLDVVELNPFLDDRGKSARILVELTASLFGRRVLDRPTRSA